jgi:glucose-1-phosphatase
VIKNILFDMDDVLCTYDFQRRLVMLADATGVPAPVIEERVFTSGFEDTADTGALTSDAYLKEFSRLIDAPVDLDAFIRARAETTIPDPQMIDVVKMVQRSHETAALTNNGWFMAENAQTIVPEIKALFGDRFFVSAQIGASKLSVEAFTILLPRLGWAPEDTLFVDDFPDYIASARTVGLHTHQFTTVEALKTDLHRLGVL